MYRVIRQHPTARKLYADKLIADGAITEMMLLDDGAVSGGLDEGRPQARARLE